MIKRKYGTRIDSRMKPGFRRKLRKGLDKLIRRIGDFAASPRMSSQYSVLSDESLRPIGLLSLLSVARFGKA